MPSKGAGGIGGGGGGGGVRGACRGGLGGAAAPAGAAALGRGRTRDRAGGGEGRQRRDDALLEHGRVPSLSRGPAARSAPSPGLSPVRRPICHRTLVLGPSRCGYQKAH